MSTDYVYDKAVGDHVAAADGKLAAESLLAKYLVIPLAAAGTAGTPLAETDPVPIAKAIRILGASFSMSGAVTAHASNYATVILNKRDAAGANKTTVASRATNATNVVARVGDPMTLAAGASSVVAGGSLSLEVTKAASGVATSAGFVVVRYREVNV